MSGLKSAIVLKDRIFMPDYDDLDKMLKELGIKDDHVEDYYVEDGYIVDDLVENDYVAVELSPINNDPFTDIDTWVMTVNQYSTPDWFNEDETEKELRKLVKEWAKTHLFRGIDGLDIMHGENIYIKDCSNINICGDAEVKYIRGNSKVNYISGNAKVYNICDYTEVKNIRGDAEVYSICGCSHVITIGDSAKVFMVSGDAEVYRILDNAEVVDTRRDRW